MPTLTATTGATKKQAEIIGKMCYVRRLNQKHCEEWATGLTIEQASKILKPLIEKKKKDGDWGSMELGRKLIKEAGYVEKEFPKSM